MNFTDIDTDTVTDTDVSVWYWYICIYRDFGKVKDTKYLHDTYNQYTYALEDFTDTNTNVGLMGFTDTDVAYLPQKAFK